MNYSLLIEGETKSNGIVDTIRATDAFEAVFLACIKHGRVKQDRVEVECLDFERGLYRIRPEIEQTVSGFNVIHKEVRVNILGRAL